MKRHRASAVCIHANRMLLVELIDFASQKKFWVPPGGAIEPGETPEQAAQREAYEEAGVRVLVWPETHLIVDYLFTWQGHNYDCQTHFYLASLVSASDRIISLDREDYILQSKWVPLKDVSTYLIQVPEIITAMTQLQEYFEHHK